LIDGHVITKYLAANVMDFFSICHENALQKASSQNCFWQHLVYKRYIEGISVKIIVEIILSGYVLFPPRVMSRNACRNEHRRRACRTCNSSKPGYCDVASQ